MRYIIQGHVNLSFEEAEEEEEIIETKNIGSFDKKLLREAEKSKFQFLHNGSEKIFKDTILTKIFII